MSPSLFPCVRIYLLRNLCLALCISVYPNLFLLGVCASLSLSGCLCLSASRFVSVCFYVSVSVVRLYCFASFCLFPRVCVCLFGNIYLSLSLSLSFCLSALVSAGRFTKMALPRCRVPYLPLSSSACFLSFCLSFRF